MKTDSDAEIEMFENTTLHKEDLLEMWAWCNDPYTPEDSFRASFNFNEDGALRLLSGSEERKLGLEEYADLYVWVRSGDNENIIRSKFRDAVSRRLDHLHNPSGFY